MVLKFCEKEHGVFTEFPLNFDAKALGQISVFFAVFDVGECIFLSMYRLLIALSFFKSFPLNWFPQGVNFF